MMLIALNSDGVRVSGSEATKGEEYYCQQCEQRVIPKKGNIKIHHFGHYPGSPSCVWWEPETQVHLLMKQEIIEILKSDNDTVFAELEYKLNLNGNILFPDVYVELRDGKKIAIECQVSNKPLSDFIEKTEQYSDSEIYTLWIFPSEDYSNDYNIVPVIQRQSHTWNFGRVYTFDVSKTNTTRNMIIGVHYKGVCKREKPIYNPNNYPPFDVRRYLITNPHIDWRPRTLKQTSISIIKKTSLLCIENDGVKIARFYDRKWW
jgi:competence CoiA-like predicted nuclease